MECEILLNAESYLFQERGIGGKLRSIPEDFYVEEIPLTMPSGKGQNIWFLIEKKNRSTLDVALDIAKQLQISRKRIGFAGMKDTNAVTRQWMCVSNIFENRVKILELSNARILEVIPNEKKLRIGHLKGNKFRIMIRNTVNSENIEIDVKTTKSVLELLMKKGVPNYYGWQRFGKIRPITHLVGKALVKNDLKDAVKSYLGMPFESESKSAQVARGRYEEGKIEESYKLMPKSLNFELMMLSVLIKESKKKGHLDENSYKKALNILPVPLKRMFVHAYQAFLFNRIISERLKLFGIDKYIHGDILIDNHNKLIHNTSMKREIIQKMIEEFEIHPSAPLFGSKVPLADEKPGEIEKKVLLDEKIKKEDFNCKLMPKLGSYGLRRAVRFQVYDVSVRSKERGIMIEFSIPKGCYATSVLREIMKAD